MKITFILPPVNLHGGIRSTAMLGWYLAKRGHDVLAVCPSKPLPSLYQQLKSVLKGKGLMDTRSRLPSAFDEIPLPLKVTEDADIITDSDIPDADIVVATWWETAEWVNNLSSAKGAKVYFIRHHEVHDYLPMERVKATYKLPLHKITISKWLVELMKTEYGDSHVSLVYNSVNFDKYCTPERGKQTIPTVGMLYSQVKWKGCDISFQAFELAKKHIPDLQMVAFGVSDPSSSLPLPTGTKYFKNPPQETIKDIYAQCDVWLCGSWSEGFHRPPLEAMSCRCPVVSTEVGGPIDRIENGVNGYLVPLGDYEALSDYLVKVLQLSEPEWKKMSDAALTTARSYTWHDAAELCEQAFYEAIKRSQSGELK